MIPDSENTPSASSPLPLARAVAPTPLPAPPNRRPKWLTAMASTSLAIALMWIFIAGLIAVLGWMIQFLAQRDPHVLKDAGLSPGLLNHLNIVAAASAFSGVWLLIAAITAYARRPITRHLHNALAVFRIVLLGAMIVGAENLALPNSTSIPGTEILTGPLAVVLIGGLELIYPVAILIVFNRKKWRDELLAAGKTAT